MGGLSPTRSSCRGHNHGASSTSAAQPPSRQNIGNQLLPVFAVASVTALLATMIGGAQTFWNYTDDLAVVYWLFAGVAITLLATPAVVE